MILGATRRSDVDVVQGQGVVPSAACSPSANRARVTICTGEALRLFVGHLGAVEVQVKRRREQGQRGELATVAAPGLGSGLKFAVSDESDNSSAGYSSSIKQLAHVSTRCHLPSHASRRVIGAELQPARGMYALKTQSRWGKHMFCLQCLCRA